MVAGLIVAAIKHISVLFGRTDDNLEIDGFRLVIVLAADMQFLVWGVFIFR